MNAIQRFFLILMVIGISVSLFAFQKPLQSFSSKKYDIIIYGGGPQAVATALKASDTTHDRANILMIVPETVLGSILTAGRQNIFDQVTYHSSKLPVGLPANYPDPQGGTNFLLQKEFPRSFAPIELADYMKNLISQHPNIRIRFQTDVTEAKTENAMIQYIKVKSIEKDQNGRWIYTKNQEQNDDRLYAPIFVDASETGRLIRLSHFEGTVGREDQGGDKTQMNASLMFKLKNVNVKGVQESHPFWNSKGLLQVWGGHDEVMKNPIASFNQTNPTFFIKPYNGASDSRQNNEFWMNMLLIYNVDARKAWRDEVAKNGLYPQSDGLDPEKARELCIEELQSPDFLQGLHSMKGFEQAELVMKNGKPDVGDIMYIRESIHAYHRNQHFALTKQNVFNDQSNFAHRIGLGFYQFDTNGYKTAKQLSNPIHKEPWYVPYEVLTTSSVQNLLLPGYAASIDSFSWTAMRVYPNLLVLGDAAGVAAGLAVERQFHLQDPSEKEFHLLQDDLRKEKAILDK